MAITLLETRDHSHTLYVPELDETYHSRNGAVEEAMYVYIGRGLRDWVGGGRLVGPQSTVDGGEGREEQSVLHQSHLSSQSEITPSQSAIHPVSVLEIGFGTGLNAWLTALECASLGVSCVYHTIEAFPLDAALVDSLNYTEAASDENKQIFNDLHRAEWNTAITITDLFTLQKEHVQLQEYQPKTTFDIIYFDAFAPEKQPELWTEEIFTKLFNSLSQGGVIVTYSAKGDIKRLWRKIGIEVERLPGPPMKRHMLRGRKGLRKAD